MKYPWLKLAAWTIGVVACSIVFSGWNGATAQDDSIASSEGNEEVQPNPPGERIVEPADARNRDARLDSRLRSLVIQARNALDQMAREASGAEQLESLLARLHHPGPSDDRLALLQRMADQKWLVGRDDSDVASLLRARLRAPSSYGKKFLVTGRQYVELANDDFPLNWRLRRAYWLQLVTTVAESRAADDPAAIWRKHIAGTSNPQDLVDARLAYLAVVRVNPAAQLELELLDPLYSKSDDPSTAMRRLGQIYAAAASRNHESVKQLLTEMRRRLSVLSTTGHGRGREELFRSLGANVRHALVRDVLLQAPPSLLVAYAEGASLSPNEIASLFLSKEVDVNFHELTPYRAFAELLDQVELSVWIDEELISASKSCSLNFAGTWKDATQRLAASLEWRFLEISDGIFYLGPGDKLKHTDPMLKTSRRRLPIPGDIQPELHRAISALESRQQSQFVAVPLLEVAQRLTEMNAIEIDLRGVGRKIVTSISREIPVHLTLSLVCYQADAKWFLDETGAVVIEPNPGSQREAHQRERREARQYRAALQEQKAVEK